MMESGPRKKRGRHKSGHHDGHRTSSRPKRGSNRDQSSRSGRSREVRPTSSFAQLPPSSAPVSLETKKQPAPVWRGYLFGLAGVLVLILLGGGHHVVALSWSLLLPGVALLYRPPRLSPGVWMDRFAFAFLAALLLAFLPQFYWPTPDWRVAAAGEFQIALPAVLTIQPLLSIEAWLSTLAGFAWFYVATSWEINHTGRQRFYAVLSVVLGTLAVIILWGNQTGARYPGAETAGVFSFFPNPRHTANFLAVGGVAAFGYSMCVLGTRKVLPVLGFLAAMLGFLALGWGVSRPGALLFIAGLLAWYLLQLRYRTLPKIIKLGFPVFILALCALLLNQSSSDGPPADFAASPEVGSDHGPALVAKDTWAMIKEAPLTGQGLGNFSAIFPQYRLSSVGTWQVLHPESDVLWLTAEAGLLGLLLLGGFLLAYFSRCSGFSRGPSGIDRLVALAALLAFILHALVDVPGHQPGTVYFVILLAALALPRSKQPRPSLSPRLWRICGGFLVLFSLGWGLAGLTGLPLHSETALAKYKTGAREDTSVGDRGSRLSALNQWIDLHPLSWRPYFQRATSALSGSGNPGRAAADFRRARFLEPSLGLVALDEGFAWIPHDHARTLAAWREVFSREFSDREAAYQRMLDAAEQSPELLEGLSALSRSHHEFRVDVLKFLSGEDLMQALRRERKNDPRLSRFNRSQRSAIVENWILRGDKAAAEKFLRENESSLIRPWWLWSLLQKEQAEFKEAVDLIRSAITPPALPDVSIKGASLERLQRELAVTPGDIIKGTALLRIYLRQGNYQKISEVSQLMIAFEKKLPTYISYWNAESYFNLKDYIESWYAYERYLKQVWNEE